MFVFFFAGAIISFFILVSVLTSLRRTSENTRRTADGIDKLREELRLRDKEPA